MTIILKKAVPAAPAIRKIYRSATDNVLIADNPSEFGRWCRDNIPEHRHGSGFGSWGGGHSFEQTCKAAERGDMTRAARSDEMLAKFEQVPLMTSVREYTDDVVGMVPNVPAYIAGIPENMCRVETRVNDASPIAIVMDTTTSGGINAYDVEKRGTALLALVRALSARRPVELYVGAGLGRNGSDATWIFCRIDTAPLDLARAAPMLTMASVSRGLMYGACDAAAWAGSANGNWPYNSFAVSSKHFRAVVAHHFSHMSEFLAIPGIILNDPMTKDGIGWVKARLAEFAGDDALAA